MVNMLCKRCQVLSIDDWAWSHWWCGIVDCNIVINLQHILILHRCRRLVLCLSKTFLNWFISQLHRLHRLHRYIYFQFIWMNGMVTTWLFPMEQMYIYSSAHSMDYYDSPSCIANVGISNIQYFQFQSIRWRGNEIRKRHSHYYYMDIEHCTLCIVVYGAFEWVVQNGCIFMHKCIY